MKQWVANEQRRLGKKWKGQDERSQIAQGKGCSRKSDGLGGKKPSQPKSKINLEKYGGVPVNGERETIWERQAETGMVYLVKPLALSSGGKSGNCRV